VCSSDLDARQSHEEARLTAAIEANQTEQEKNKWGGHTMMFEDEAFFGQDRIDLLEWRLENVGVKRL